MSSRSLQPLHRALLNRTTTRLPFCYDGADIIEWRDLVDSVARRTAALQAHPAKRWLLVEQTFPRFACGLFALLHAGKNVVLPPNMQPGSVTSLRSTDAFDAVFDFDPAALQPSALSSVDPAAPSITLYTSGSTGEPKKVEKNLAQLEAEVEALEQLWGDRMGARCVLATVPHHHIYGLLFRLLWPLSAGRPCDATQCGDPDTLMQRIRRLPESVLVASPAQLSRLPELIDLDQSRVRPALIFSSGGPLTMATSMALAEGWNTAPIEVYGSTETGGIAWREQVRDARWTPFPRVEIQRGVDGGLLLRSPFLGTEDLFRTEDAIELHEDLRFSLRGRLDRIVKIEEKRLSLAEMEGRLGAHEWVRESALLALQQRRQYVGAAIVLTSAGRLRLHEQGRNDVIRALKAHLASHYETPLLPRRWRFIERLPLNERGKINSSTLSALFSRNTDTAIAA